MMTLKSDTQKRGEKMAYAAMILGKFVLCAGLALVSFVICKIIDKFLMTKQQEESAQLHFEERR